MKLETSVKFFTVPKAEDDGVNVGWFSDQKYDDNTSIAQVARWQEFGTKQGIPQRPFMRETMMRHKTEWYEKLLSRVQKAIDENKSIDKELKKFGEIVKGDIQETILGGGFMPNARITIYGGWMKNKTTGKPIYVKGKGQGLLPLIDTGIMLSSIQARTDKELTEDV